MTARSLLAALLLLTACSEDEAGVRLSGWVSSPAEDTLVRERLADFAAANPDSPVRYQPIQANYAEKIQLMLGTGTAPDVFMLDALRAPALIDFDVLAPLDDFIAADPDFDLEDFEPGFLNAFRHKGKLYSIPKDYSTLVLFYNPAMLAAAGLEGPPRTWAAFADYARRLTRDLDGDGKSEQIGFGMEASLEYVLPFIWQAGGFFLNAEGVVTADDPGLNQALAYLRDLKREGAAALPTDVGASWTMEGFGRGRFAMAISGYWALSFMAETFPDQPYATVTLPMGQQEGSIAFLVGYVMPKASANKAKGWQLIRYLTSRQGQRAAVAQGIALPPRRSVARASGLDSDPITRPFIDAATYARPWQLGTDQRLGDEAATALQAILLIDEPIDKALDRLERRLAR